MASASDSEENVKEVDDVPPRKRGRPPKQSNEGDEEVAEAPKARRSPGRPKGSKNKTHKEKPVDIEPKRARGRPRKWPPVEKPTGPKRKRGRPRKNPLPVETEDVEESAEQDDNQT